MTQKEIALRRRLATFRVEAMMVSLNHGHGRLATERQEVNLSGEDIGRSVIYDPPHPGARSGRGEEGIITSFNDHIVFVRYGSDKHSKGTDPRDLRWTNGH